MTMLLSLMLAATPVAAGPVPPMPQDLSHVPVIDGWLGRKISPRWSEDVAKLYRKGKCGGAIDHEGSRLLEIDMLFLLSDDGKPLKIAPVNAHCPDVEEFVSRRILGTLRNSFPRNTVTTQAVVVGGRASDAQRTSPSDQLATPHWMRSQVRFLWSDAP
jgi:hypothetical protein